MTSLIEKRLSMLEQRHRSGQRLSSERRKYLTDKAVAGDQEARRCGRCGIDR